MKFPVVTTKGGAELLGPVNHTPPPGAFLHTTTGPPLHRTPWNTQEYDPLSSPWDPPETSLRTTLHHSCVRLPGTPPLYNTIAYYSLGHPCAHSLGHPCIWLIFTRTLTPLEIFRWFPQIVFTLLTCVRPINVGFSNRFFCLSDKRCLMLIIKKNVEEDIS